MGQQALAIPYLVAMRRLTAFLVTVSFLALAVPATGSAKSQRLGYGSKTCAPKPGANCAGVRAKGKFVNHGDLSRINLRGARLVKANLSGADLTRADLTGADLRGANLKGVDLRHAKLDGANLGPVKPVRASQGTPSCNPNCTGANLQEADLSWASLSKANLSSASLYNSVLNYADLSYANMTSVYAYDSIMMFAFMLSANLTNADLADTILYNAWFGGATANGTLWQGAICPNGTKATSACDIT